MAYHLLREAVWPHCHYTGSRLQGDLGYRHRRVDYMRVQKEVYCLPGCHAWCPPPRPTPHPSKGTCMALGQDCQLVIYTGSPPLPPPPPTSDYKYFFFLMYMKIGNSLVAYQLKMWHCHCCAASLIPVAQGLPPASGAAKMYIYSKVKKNRADH